MQETARFEVKDDLIVHAFHARDIERFDRAFGLAMAIAKRGEVMLAAKQLRGCIHGSHINRTPNAPGSAVIQRKRRAAIDHFVRVGAVHRIEARMKLWRCFFSAAPTKLPRLTLEARLSRAGAAVAGS